MKTLMKITSFEESLRRFIAVKNFCLEFIGMMLAVIFIIVQNDVCLVKRSFHRTYAELSASIVRTNSHMQVKKHWGSKVFADMMRHYNKAPIGMQCDESNCDLQQ